jgi:excisionase family DNA binding protein
MDNLNKCDNWVKDSITQIKTDIRELKGINHPFFKVKGAAIFLGVSERRIYSLISDGDIAYYKNKSGRIRFSRKQLMDYETYKEIPVSSKVN